LALETPPRARWQTKFAPSGGDLWRCPGLEGAFNRAVRAAEV